MRKERLWLDNLPTRKKPKSLELTFFFFFPQESLAHAHSQDGNDLHNYFFSLV